MTGDRWQAWWVAGNLVWAEPPRSTLVPALLPCVRGVAGSRLPCAVLALPSKRAAATSTHPYLR